LLQGEQQGIPIHCMDIGHDRILELSGNGMGQCVGVAGWIKQGRVPEKQIRHYADIGGHDGEIAGKHLAGLLRETEPAKSIVRQGDDSYIQCIEQSGDLFMRKVAEVMNSISCWPGSVWG